MRLGSSRIVRTSGTIRNRNQRIIQFVLMAVATGYVATMLGPLPEFIQQIAGDAIANLVVWDSVGDSARD